MKNDHDYTPVAIAGLVLPAGSSAGTGGCLPDIGETDLWESNGTSLRVRQGLKSGLFFPKDPSKGFNGNVNIHVDVTGTAAWLEGHTDFDILTLVYDISENEGTERLRTYSPAKVAQTLTFGTLVTPAGTPKTSRPFGRVRTVDSLTAKNFALVPMPDGSLSLQLSTNGEYVVETDDAGNVTGRFAVAKIERKVLEMAVAVRAGDGRAPSTVKITTFLNGKAPVIEVPEAEDGDTPDAFESN